MLMMVALLGAVVRVDEAPLGAVKFETNADRDMCSVRNDQDAVNENWRTETRASTNARAAVPACMEEVEVNKLASDSAWRCCCQAH